VGGNSGGMVSLWKRGFYRKNGAREKTYRSLRAREVERGGAGEKGTHLMEVTRGGKCIS